MNSHFVLVLLALTFQFCVSDILAQSINPDEIRAPQIVLSFDLSGQLRASMVAEQTGTGNGRNYFSNPIIIEELDLSDEQRGRYMTVLARWENLESQHFKNNAVLRQTQNELSSREANGLQSDLERRTQQYQESCRNLVLEIEQVLLPHQRIAVQQMTKRLNFVELGLTNYVNHNWNDLGLSVEEFSGTIQNGRTVIAFLDKKVGELRNEVFSVLVDGLSAPVQEHLKPRFETAFSQVPLEALKWQLQCLDNEDFDIDLNRGLEIYFEVPFLEVQFNGELKPLQNISRSKSPSARFQVILDLVESEEWCVALEISESEKNTIYNIQDQYDHNKIEWKQLPREEADEARILFERDSLKQMEKLIVVPRKRQFAEMFCLTYAERCYGPIALLARGVTQLELTPADRNRLLANAKQSVQLIDKQSRAIYSQVLELESSKLTPSNQKKILDHIGPPFRNSTPSLLYMKFNLMNLR